MLIFCMGIAACGEKSDVPEGYQLVSGDNAAYRFYAPTQWSINTGTSQNSAYYSVDDRSIVVVTIYVKDQDYTSTDDFWSIVESNYMENFDDYNFISKNATVLSGKNAMSYTYSLTIAGSPVKIMQIIAPHGNYYYALTYTSTPEKFDSHLEDVNGMAGVFEIK